MLHAPHCRAPQRHAWVVACLAGAFAIAPAAPTQAKVSNNTRKAANANPAKDDGVQKHLKSYNEAGKAMTQAKAAYDKAQAKLKSVLIAARKARQESEGGSVAINPDSKEASAVDKARQQLESAKLLALGVLSKDAGYIDALRVRAMAKRSLEDARANVGSVDTKTAMRQVLEAEAAVGKLEAAVLEKDALVKRAEEKLDAAMAKYRAERKEQIASAAEAKQQQTANDPWREKIKQAQAEVTESRSAYQSAVRKRNAIRSQGERAFDNAVARKNAAQRKLQDQREKERYEKNRKNGQSQRAATKKALRKKGINVR